MWTWRVMGGQGCLAVDEEGDGRAGGLGVDFEDEGEGRGTVT